MADVVDLLPPPPSRSQSHPFACGFLFRSCGHAPGTQRREVEDEPKEKTQRDVSPTSFSMTSHKTKTTVGTRGTKNRVFAFFMRPKGAFVPAMCVCRIGKSSSVPYLLLFQLERKR
jgi:hypothetical protein